MSKPDSFSPPSIKSYPPPALQNDCRLESRRFDVRASVFTQASMLTATSSYNRYLAIAARTVRRSLKDGPRLASERRGQMDLRFAKWEVSE